MKQGPSWSWSYGTCSWIYNYLCNQCLTLRVRIPLRRGVLNTTLCDKVCQWFASGRWFSPLSSTNKTYRHNITEILLKVALNIINYIIQGLIMNYRYMAFKLLPFVEVFFYKNSFRNKILNETSGYSRVARGGGPPRGYTFMGLALLGLLYKPV